MKWSLRLQERWYLQLRYTCLLVIWQFSRDILSRSCSSLWSNRNTTVTPTFLALRQHPESDRTTVRLMNKGGRTVLSASTVNVGHDGCGLTMFTPGQETGRAKYTNTYNNSSSPLVTIAVLFCRPLSCG